MYAVISCLTTEHDYRLVLVAAFVCLLGTSTAFLLLDRGVHAPTAHRKWSLAAAAATGITIWATHFIAMLAYDGGMPVGFDFGLTVLSAAAGIVLSVAGYHIGFSNSIFRQSAGGGIVAVGIATMHFIGMAALEAPAHQTYDLSAVAVAGFAGAALAAGAFVAFRHISTSARIVAAAFAMTLAICALHFVSMSAMTLVPDPSVEFSQASAIGSWLAYSVATVVTFLLLTAVGTVIAHRRFDFHRAETRRFRSLADASTEGIIIARGEQILEMNEKMLRFLREGQVDAAGVRITDILPELDLRSDARSHCATEANLFEGLSEPIPVEVLHRSIVHHGAAAEVIVLRDLRERREANARIEYLAHYDSLTGLPNRTLLNDRLSRALIHAKSAQEKVAVFCLDLDRFKTVNDVYGHAMGDEVLRKAASVLTSVTRETDTVARLGGDEFVIIQSGAAQPEDARRLAQRLVQAFGEEFRDGSQTPNVGISVGFALFPDAGSDAETLLSNADTALYRSKTAGRGTWRVFEASMDEAVRERRVIEQHLRLALIERQLYLDYQPQADAKTGSIIGFEALVRWKHPQRGQIPPTVFIPIAEESGLMAELGLWVLREAAREAAGWKKPLQVAVNVSPVQFYQNDLAERIEIILAEVGLDPRRLELEITESALIGDRDAVLKVLHRLKAVGVRFAMDDFGTGYSSLSNLQSFPFDKIKIDRSFVSNLGINAEAIEIIRAIVALGKTFKLPVVAEGVETERQHEILRQELCNELQGYLFGVPQPIRNFKVVTRGDRKIAA